MVSALLKPPLSPPITSPLFLANSEVLPSSISGEVSLQEPGSFSLSSSCSVLNDLLPQNTRRGGGTSLEGLQLGRVLRSCTQLRAQVAARASLAEALPCKLHASSLARQTVWQQARAWHRQATLPVSKPGFLPQGPMRGLEPQSCACICVWRRCGEEENLKLEGRREVSCRIWGMLWGSRSSQTQVHPVCWSPAGSWQVSWGHFRSQDMKVFVGLLLFHF